MGKMFKLSYKIKLFFLITLAFLVPIFVLEIINIFDNIQYKNYMIDKIDEVDLNNQVIEFNHFVTDMQSLVTKNSVLIGKSIENGASADELNELLLEILQQTPKISNIYYSNEADENIVAVHTDDPIVNGKTRIWYQKALKNRFHVSTLYQDSITRKKVMTFSHVVYKNGVFEGVVGMDIPFSKIYEMYIKEFNIRGTEMLIMLDTGDVFFESTPNILQIVEKYKKDKENWGILSGLINKNVIIKKRLDAVDSEIILVVNASKYFYSKKSIEHNKMFKVRVLIMFVLFITAYFVADNRARTLNKLEKNITKIVSTPSNYYDIESNLYVCNKYDDLNEILEIFKVFKKEILLDIENIKRGSEEIEEKNRKIEESNRKFEKSNLELKETIIGLSKLDNEYKNLLNNVADFVWVIDEYGVIIECNDKMLSVLGYRENELIGMTIMDISPEYKDIYGEDTYRMLYMRDYDNINIALNKKDDKGQILTSTSTTRIFQNELVKEVQIVSHDITAEKEYNEQIKRKNKDLMLINKISREITIRENVNEILKTTLDSLDEILNIEIACTRRKEKNGDYVLEYLKGENNYLLKNFDYRANIPLHLKDVLENKQNIIINGKEDLKFKNDKMILNVIDSGYNLAIFILSDDIVDYGSLTIVTKDKIDDRVSELLESVSNNLSVFIEKVTLFDTLEDNYFKVVEMLVTVLETRNAKIKGHAIRVANIAKYIAKKLYLTQEQIKDVYVSALLHDVGKIGLGDNVLEHLDEYENDINIIQDSLLKGLQVLEPIGLKQEVINAVYYQYKNFDGSGYPEDDIVSVPLYSLIIRLASDIDILIRNKKYESMYIYKACRDLAKGKGTKYSPEMVEVIDEAIREQDPEFLSVIYEI